MIFKALGWLKFAILLFCTILILIGFMMGYIINSSCNNNPFQEGIKKLNEVTDSEFKCYCKSNNVSIHDISFDKDGVINEIYLEQIK